MKLTTKGRYAVTAMLDLALHDVAGPVCLSEIASRQHISLPYLEQLFTRLRREGLVASTRGPGGGYNLAQPMQGISVAEIICAVDEPLDATQCGGKENCLDDKRCMTHDLWATVNAKMYDYLSSVTLADLVAHQCLAEHAELGQQDQHRDDVRAPGEDARRVCGIHQPPPR